MIGGGAGKRRGLTPEFYRDKLVARLQDEGITAPSVLAAIGKVPRHAFVDEAWDLKKSYADTALPIGRGQTISQPYIVALMTQALLGERAPRHVLEVGTGCGYQTAVLAELVDRVYSVERIRSLHLAAGERLRQLNYLRIYLLHGDGMLGWPQQAPFDAVIVTAASEEVPHALLEQLAPGGRLVIPLGPQSGPQTLCRFIRQPGGGYTRDDLAAVSFVPLLPETMS